MKKIFEWIFRIIAVCIGLYTVGLGAVIMTIILWDKRYIKIIRDSKILDLPINPKQ